MFYKEVVKRRDEFKNYVEILYTFITQYNMPYNI